MTEALILPFSRWPTGDQNAWNDLFRENDIFFDRGRAADWSAGTRQKCRQSYGYFLGFLDRSGRLDPDRPAVERFQVEDIADHIEVSRERVSLRSVEIQVSDLLRIAHALDPDKDWSAFERLAWRIRHRAGSIPLKPGLGIDSATIFSWAIREMGAALDLPTTTRGWKRPVRYRDGLMVGLLIARPLRLRTFIHMRLGTHLLRAGEGFELCFEAGDMKDKRARSFSLPEELVDPMEVYLDEIRPCFSGAEATDALWMSRQGGALSYDGFQAHLHHITLDAFGTGLRPHAFRHIAATSIAEHDPQHASTMASLLAHASLATSEKHYNRASMLSAANRYQSLVSNLRRQGKRRSDE